MLREEDIWSALRDCYDPEIPLNVVELGLVVGVELTADPKAPGVGIPGVPMRFSVVITLVPSSRDEAAEAQLGAQVANRLAGLYEVARVRVVMAEEPVWTPARITAEGRRTLGLDRPQFPILNNKVRSV